MNQLTLSSLLTSWSTTLTARYDSPSSLTTTYEYGKTDEASQNLCMTAALSENLMALLRAFTDWENLSITKPVRMPASNK